MFINTEIMNVLVCVYIYKKVLLTNEFEGMIIYLSKEM